VASVTLGEVDSNLVTETDGRLACPCMGWKPGIEYLPCKHVWEAMKRRLDATESFGPLAIVPLFRTPVHERTVIVELHLHRTDKKGSMTPFYLQGEYTTYHVGWLDEGEARWEMRMVTLEWLRSLYRTVGQCSRADHQHYLLSATERERLDLDSALPHVIAAIASRVQYGMCWRCMLVQDSSDLVPQP
jgi:hypothetical protein